MVRGKKMKNPLRKRLPRELKTEFGKYLVIFLLLVATIGLVSGFLVADGSMIIAYNEGFEKYNVENGNFLSTCFRYGRLAAETLHFFHVRGVSRYLHISVKDRTNCI